MKSFAYLSILSLSLFTAKLFSVASPNQKYVERQEKLGRNSQFTGVGTVVANRCDGKSRLFSNLGLYTGIAIDSRTVLTVASPLQQGEKVSFYCRNPLQNEWIEFRGTVYQHPEHKVVHKNGDELEMLNCNLALITLDEPMFFAPPVYFLENALPTHHVATIVGAGCHTYPAEDMGKRKGMPKDLKPLRAFRKQLFCLEGFLNETNETLYACQYHNPPVKIFGLETIADDRDDGSLEGIGLPGDLGAPAFIKVNKRYEMFGWLSIAAARPRHGALNCISNISDYADWIHKNRGAEVAIYRGNNGKNMWSNEKIWQNASVPGDLREDGKVWNVVCEEGGSIKANRDLHLDNLAICHEGCSIDLSEVAHIRALYLAEGEIRLKGRLYGEIFLAGGVLSGSGTIEKPKTKRPWKPAIYQTGGTFAPKRTLVLGGNLYQNANAITLLKTPYARVIVKGEAKIGGTLDIAFSPDNLTPGRKCTFLQTDSLEGTYEKVLVEGEEVDPTLIMYEDQAASIYVPIYEEPAVEEDLTIEENSVTEEDSAAKEENPPNIDDETEETTDSDVDTNSLEEEESKDSATEDNQDATDRTPEPPLNDTEDSVEFSEPSSDEALPEETSELPSEEPSSDEADEEEHLEQKEPLHERALVGKEKTPDAAETEETFSEAYEEGVSAETSEEVSSAPSDKTDISNSDQSGALLVEKEDVQPLEEEDTDEVDREEPDMENSDADNPPEKSDGGEDATTIESPAHEVIAGSSSTGEREDLTFDGSPKEQSSKQRLQTGDFETDTSDTTILSFYW